MSTSIWIKPSGMEVMVNESSAAMAESLGWKRKTETVEVKKKRLPKPKD